MELEKFYSKQSKKPNFSEELDQCIKKAYEKCIESLDQKSTGSESIKPVMLLGRIQSGKTNAYTRLIALSFDKLFDMAIILTKNNKALISQTYKRMKSEFREEINNHEIQVIDIMNTSGEKMTEYELSKKTILIAKKEKNNLSKIENFISMNRISPCKYCLVIDDEADTTSIGFYKVKDTEDDFDLRKVASMINSIRGSLAGYVFVQVTATPYALFLQPEFNEKEIESIKPQLPILVPIGKDYYGGEYFFLESKKEDSPARFIYEEVSVDESEIISSPNGDRRKFKEEEIIKENKKLKIFIQGIINFIIGGCILRMRRNTNDHFSYVIHNDQHQASHSRVEKITKNLYDGLRTRDQTILPEIEKLIERSYIDIEKSITAYSLSMPSLSDVKKEFYKAIDKDYLSISVINSKTETEAYLNEDTGELYLRTPFSIFIGGQVLDRGVTIPNMVGFYYTRSPKVMQQDTVMQHSRIFGYRELDLLSITRFYTTRRIYESLTKITEIDKALREDIEKYGTEEIYFIQKDINGKIVPCSPQKIQMSNVVVLKQGSRILPIGFTPKSKKISKPISEKIDVFVKRLANGKENDAILVSTSQIEQIIDLAYSAIEPDKDSMRFVEKEKFLAIFNFLAKKQSNAYLIVRRDRKLSKYKENGTLYSDSPDTPQDELQLAKEKSINFPSLIIIEEDGTGAGWMGREFWWPILVVQKNFTKTIFSLDEPEGRIRQS